MEPDRGLRHAGLTAGLLAALLDEAERKSLDILLPETESGMPEPLCAVYHRDALAPLERAFAGGIRKVTAAFDGLRVAPLPGKRSGLLSESEYSRGLGWICRRMIRTRTI